MVRHFTLWLTLALIPGCGLLFPQPACFVDADCEDGDPCTVDECAAGTRTCAHDPVDCPAGQQCSSETGTCVASGGTQPTGSSELKRFESEEALADYLTGQITARNVDFLTIETLAEPAPPEGDLSEGVAGDGSAPGGGAEGQVDAGAPDESSDDRSFSETTIQEQGVDEADVVKTDGTYLYIIHDSFLRIVQVSPPEAMQLVRTIPLEGYGREIYLYDGRVVAITETYGGYLFDGAVPEPAVLETEARVGPDAPEASDVDGASGSVPVVRFQRPQTIVAVIDVSVPQEARVVTQTSFDGSQASTRMIDGVLHLVLANYQDYYYDVLPLLGQSTLDLSTVEVASLLPHYQRVDENMGEAAGPVVNWETMFRPTDPDGFGVVTVVSMDVNDSSTFKAVGIAAEPGLVYSSRDALYLTDAYYGFSTGSRANRQETDIYKFDYAQGGAVPVATGTVPGRVLNQYSMGEYQGYLRVATTVDARFFGESGRTQPYNNVYVLGQADTALEVVGKVEGIAFGEEVKSARFIGDRGYLVTAVRVDPLHTLDLADPANPRVVGKLVVPGFSTFIVPMDSDHLLTVGQYLDEQDFFAPRGVQLSIFDVSDFSTPRQSFNVIIGGDAVSFTDAYSEALTNPKAFTYFASAGLVALPVTINSYSSPFFDDVFIGPGVDVSDGGVGGSGSGGTAEPGSFAALPAQPVEDENFSGLVVYRVSTEEGFTELGRISAAFDQALFSWTAFTRGVFIEDTVFAATNQGVRGAPIDDVASAPYELFFGDESPIDENGTIADGAESDSSSPGDGVDANAGALPRPLPTPQANP